ncbi:PTS lactose/cellobiose transporter subunit IIA [Paenibacillus sp. DMB5]|uniref:PTS lactose/cellobiose transporter subunit IIA n=1 Tax=Paenibacillus sp. DMB5 TaxID=1780103 RepID=UPI00076D0905|nr:PTS lactose/cellobiose transporter subunit IIA [Paenibacillus sp. DMB5]KUP25919.1 PTS cellobiose transporter subunit IIA [Paenibacillus sp. DMB5]
MQEVELVSFQIISAVGTARSMYIEAIQEAKAGNIEQARELIAEGAKVFVEGHRAHKKLVTQEANNEPVNITLLLMHAEDQLMSAEGFKIIAEEFIALYERVQK